MKKYTHLTFEERSEIEYFLKKGYSIRTIAGILKRGPSTISEEIKRNNVNGVYDSRKAKQKAYTKRKYAKYEGMKVVEHMELKQYVDACITHDWSPESVSGRLKCVDKHLPYISKEGIYKYIYSPYGRNLEKHLRHYKKARNKRDNTKVTSLENRVFIDKRPKSIENRRRFGDWEGDFIVSGKSGTGVLFVMYERKSKYVIVRKLATKSVKLVHATLQDIVGGLVIFNSLTLDNDIVFRKHEELSRILGVPVYFCHPYHSWEKGGVENINKLIRQYVRKGSDISLLTDEKVHMIEMKLNNRPRKCLRYRTPQEIMEKNKQLKKSVRDILTRSHKTKIPSVRLGG
jgi:transposase, IS30 family